MGLASLMADPTANESTGAPDLLEVRDALRVEAAGHDDLDVVVAGEIKSCANLLHQVGRHPAALGGRVQPHTPQAITQRVRNSQRFLRLVLERVDQGDAWHLGVDVTVEGLQRADRVAEDQDQRVRHGAGWRESRQPRPGRGGCADAAADHAGIVHLIGNRRMHVACSEADDRDRVRHVHDAPRGGCPASALGQDAQDRRLVQAVCRVSGGDAHHHLLARHAVPVAQRLHHRLHVEALPVAQHLAQIGERLLGAAQDGVFSREDLHGRHRVQLLGGEDGTRPVEVDVRGLAGQDLARGLESRPLWAWLRHGAAV